MNKKEIASQKKTHSAYESMVNIVVGAGINILAQHFIFPLFGIHISWHANLEIAGIFTVISLVRSYCLRRAFNWYHVKTV